MANKLPWIYTLQRMASARIYSKNYKNIREIDTCFYYNYANNSIESWSLNDLFDIVLEKNGIILDEYDVYNNMIVPDEILNHSDDGTFKTILSDYLKTKENIKIHLITNGNNMDRINIIKKCTDFLHETKNTDHIFLSINIKFQALFSVMSTILNNQQYIILNNTNTLSIGIYGDLLGVYFLDTFGNIKFSYLYDWANNLQDLEYIIEEVSEKKMPLTVILDGDYKSRLSYENLKNIINSTNLNNETNTFLEIDEFSGKILLRAAAEYSNTKWPRILFYDFEIITNTTTQGKNFNSFLTKLFNSDYGKYIYHQIQFIGTRDINYEKPITCVEVDTMIEKCRVVLM